MLSPEVTKHLEWFALAFLLILGACGPSSHTIDRKQEPFSLTRIQSDTLFQSRQSISILSLPKESLQWYEIALGYSNPELAKTSSIAGRYNAIAAVNGGFFDMTKGGSVNYFELNDSVINRSRSPELAWAKPSAVTNGAVVLTRNGELQIRAAEPDTFYEISREEAAVLVSGPLLIHESQTMTLPDIPFSNNRHPRTCLCTKEDTVLFIAIDGRRETAAGMSLSEAQEFLRSLGCVHAINLDGGGSTTLWTKDHGIVNNPSDRTGERPVANAILIIEK